MQIFPCEGTSKNRKWLQVNVDLPNWNKRVQDKRKKAKQLSPFRLSSFDFVGVAGFEPATSCSQSRRDEPGYAIPRNLCECGV
jgi:hypothetical protein